MVHKPKQSKLDYCLFNGKVENDMTDTSSDVNMKKSNIVSMFPTKEHETEGKTPQFCTKSKEPQVLETSSFALSDSVELEMKHASLNIAEKAKRGSIKAKRDDCKVQRKLKTIKKSAEYDDIFEPERQKKTTKRQMTDASKTAMAAVQDAASAKIPEIKTPAFAVMELTTKETELEKSKDVKEREDCKKHNEQNTDKQNYLEQTHQSMEQGTSSEPETLKRSKILNKEETPKETEEKDKSKPETSSLLSNELMCLHESKAMFKNEAKEVDGFEVLDDVESDGSETEDDMCMV